eukprot:6173004-Pleurochrysis_carterae.AAC.6
MVRLARAPPGEPPPSVRRSVSAFRPPASSWPRMRVWLPMSTAREDAAAAHAFHAACPHSSMTLHLTCIPSHTVAPAPPPCLSLPPRERAGRSRTHPGHPDSSTASDRSSSAALPPRSGLTRTS